MLSLEVWFPHSLCSKDPDTVSDSKTDKMGGAKLLRRSQRRPSTRGKALRQACDRRSPPLSTVPWPLMRSEKESNALVEALVSLLRHWPSIFNLRCFPLLIVCVQETAPAQAGAQWLGRRPWGLPGKACDGRGTTGKLQTMCDTVSSSGITHPTSGGSCEHFVS